MNNFIAELFLLTFLLSCNFNKKITRENTIKKNSGSHKFFKDLDLSKKDAQLLKKIIDQSTHIENILLNKNSSNQYKYHTKKAGSEKSVYKNVDEGQIEEINDILKNNLEQNIDPNSDKSKKETSKYKLQIKKVMNKFNKKYKTPTVLVLALVAGLIVALSLLSIFTGGMFLLFVAIMAGLSSFRLFRKLKEEFPLHKWCKKRFNKNIKDKHKNKLDTKKKTSYIKKEKVELGFFISLALIVSFLIALSFLGFFSLLLAPVILAALAGLATIRRVKLFFDGRL